MFNTLKERDRADQCESCDYRAGCTVRAAYDGSSKATLEPVRRTLAAMLTHLRIKNFKAWEDTGDMRLAPLTVVFGTNSSGKSSLGHLLLALKQTAQSTDRKRALHLGDGNTLIDLGTFDDCLFGHAADRSLEFTLRWRLPEKVVVRNAAARDEAYEGNVMELRAAIGRDKANQPQTSQFRYRLLQDSHERLKIIHARKESAGTLSSEPLKLVHAVGRKWPVEPPERFYRFTDRTLLRYQNADFLAEFALETERLLSHFYYLGPLRKYPQRQYGWAGDTPPDVGKLGEQTIGAILSAARDNRLLNRAPRKPLKRFDAFIASWLKDLGVIDSFEIKPVADGRKEYEVLIRTHPGTAQVKLTDVGFGVSQVLPALVQAFYAPPGSVVWMEQPEIHLHPLAQANLADAFISAVHAGEGGQSRETQLIVESHSEHFLTRLQRRVAEQVIRPDDVAIYYVNRRGPAAELEPLPVDMFGEIVNWPPNFFGDEMGDIAARARAAADLRKRQKLRAA
jgi:predicted ATPase